MEGCAAVVTAAKARSELVWFCAQLDMALTVLAFNPAAVAQDALNCISALCCPSKHTRKVANCCCCAFVGQCTFNKE